MVCCVWTRPIHYFLIAASIAAINPKGANIFPNEIAGLINFGNNLPKIDPKAPPDIISFFYL